MVVPDVDSTRTLGPANYQARVQTGALVEDTVFAVTFRQKPVHLAAYDPGQRQVTDAWEVPVTEFSDSPGAWNVTAYDERFLYSVMHKPTEMFRFDREAETFERVARLPETVDTARDCKGIAARDGRLFLAAKTDPVLYAFDHATDELREVAPAHPSALKAHDLAIGEDEVFVGGGSEAYLSGIDPETGDRRDLLPPSLAGEESVQSVALTPDGRVVAGTNGGLAVLDPGAALKDATVVRVDLAHDPGAVTSLHATETTAYFSTCDPDYTLWAYEYGADGPRRLAAPIGHPTRAIHEYGGGLLGVGSGGYSAVWTLDPVTGETTRTRLGEVGLPRGAGNLQSLRAIGSDVYAGGSRVTGVHGVDAGEFEQFTSPGEPKVMRVVDGRLYQAVYGGAGIVEYDPETGESRELAWIGTEQNRPRSMHYHEPTGFLLVGTRPEYGQLGGAIAAYDLDADELASVDRHVVPDQSVTALSSIGETVYLGTEIRGGIGADPTATRARIAAWDPAARTLEWETPVEAETVRGLTAVDDVLYGQAGVGRFFAFDPASREVVHERPIGPGEPQDPAGMHAHDREVATGDVIASGGCLYGVTDDCLFGYDPGDGEFAVLLDGLDGRNGWHNYPQLAVDAEGALYVGDGTDLRRVELSE
ncbi:MAG: hypothetical protein ABEH66_03325 [Halobacteriales archaeon]